MKGRRCRPPGKSLLEAGEVKNSDSRHAGHPTAIPGQRSLNAHCSCQNGPEPSTQHANLPGTLDISNELLLKKVARVEKVTTCSGIFRHDGPIATAW